THELEFEIEYELGGDKDESEIRRTFFTPDGGDTGVPDEFTYEHENEDEKELSVQLDYIRPLGEEGQIEFGYRGDLERADNDRILEVYESWGASEPSSYQDFGFAQRETFNSA